MLGGSVGLKNAVLSGQIGFDAAPAIAGKDSNAAVPKIAWSALERMDRSSPLPDPKG